MLDREGTVFERLELEIVIVPGEAQTGGRKPPLDGSEPRAERLPPADRRRAFGRRELGRNDDLDAEASRGRDRSIAIVLQHRQGEVPASCAKPCASSIRFVASTSS